MKIAVTNLKGGVGKTTIAVNLAAAFTLRGKSVCIVDTDLKQHSALQWAGSRGEDRATIQVFAVEPKQVTSAMLKALEEKYDLIIIDGTPHLSELATRTILVSDIILIPILPSIFDFRAFETFFELLNELKETKKSEGLGNIEAYIVMNRVNDKTNVSKEIFGGLQSYGVPLLETKISSRTAYADNATDGMGVVEGKDKKAKEEFGRLTDEVEKIILNYKK
jgi:chromosome partitioning protein